MFCAEVSAVLPQTGDVEDRSIRFGQSSQVYIDRTSDSAPIGESRVPPAGRVTQKVANIIELEVNSLPCQARSFTTPVAQQVLVVRYPLRSDW